jgi:hypothetical protein
LDRSVREGAAIIPMSGLLRRRGRLSDEHGRTRTNTEIKAMKRILLMAALVSGAGYSLSRRER